MGKWSLLGACLTLSSLPPNFLACSKVEKAWALLQKRIPQML